MDNKCREHEKIKNILEQHEQRIDALEDSIHKHDIHIEKNNVIVDNYNAIIDEIKNMIKSLQQSIDDLKKEIEHLKLKPARLWDTAMIALVTGLIGVIIAMIFKMR